MTEGKNYRIGMSFPCKALFEFTVAVNGQAYLVIYGEHVNGYFCCLPTDHTGCEMAEPSDTFYNASSLVKACLHMSYTEAQAIAAAIKEYAARKE